MTVMYITIPFLPGNARRSCGNSTVVIACPALLGWPVSIFGPARVKSSPRRWHPHRDKAAARLNLKAYKHFAAESRCCITMQNPDTAPPGHSRQFDGAPFRSSPIGRHSPCYSACLKSAIAGSRPVANTASASNKLIVSPQPSPRGRKDKRSEKHNRGQIAEYELYGVGNHRFAPTKTSKTGNRII